MGVLRGFLDWVVHGDRPEGPPPAPTRRDELIEAKEKVRRQIEILEDGPVRGGDWTPQVPQLSDDLKETLGELEAELASIDASET